MQKKLGVAVLAALIAAPAGAYAQGVVGGAQSGAERGMATGQSMGGPIGGVVGGAVGGATGAAGGLLGLDRAPEFRAHALREHRSSVRTDRPVREGQRLPLAGVTYRPVPPEYGVDPRYRYTVVNGQPVIVDPRSRRVVQVIE
ncbi:DUF1236 domain-containing protein [Methylocella sp.]|uniref:DUF1236 domain-containing protein n=1 Tax=Methylocella sp. TaxID=1978226 RepID=UPI0037840833